MLKTILASLLATLLMTTASSAYAQQASVPRLGVLAHNSASDPRLAARLELFRQGLHDLGYVEGKTVKIEYKYAEGRAERLDQLAQELVGQKVDVLVVTNDTTARAAQKVTKTIPVVMASSGNPIGQGVIASQARPGGNVTGLTSYSPELVGKRLGLLKEVLPNADRFGFLTNEARAATGSASLTAFEEAQATARALKITFRLVKVRPTNPDFESAFREIAKERIGALVTSPSPPVAAQREKIIRLLGNNRLPAIHPDEDWANEGGLLAYGASTMDQYRRAAVFVDKILKGAKPGDLPVEGPMKFYFTINLKTAKALNLTIPQSVLFRADKVIR